MTPIAPSAKPGGSYFGTGHADGFGASITSSPGPAAYTPEKRVVNAHVARFGAGREWQHEDSIPSPGPGDYDVKWAPHQNGARATIGRGPRHQAAGAWESPGPGDYNSTSSNQVRGGSNFGTGHVGVSKQVSPGPSTYTPEKLAAHPPGTIFGTGREELESVDVTPGPGDYDADKAPNHRSVSVTIGRAQAQRHQTSSTSPGPGEYNYASIDHVPGGSYFGTGHMEFLGTGRASAPGPCTYTPEKLRAHARGIKLGRGRAWQHEDSSDPSPGPGEYC